MIMLPGCLWPKCLVPDRRGVPPMRLSTATSRLTSRTRDHRAQPRRVSLQRSGRCCTSCRKGLTSAPPPRCRALLSSDPDASSLPVPIDLQIVVQAALPACPSESPRSLTVPAQPTSARTTSPPGRQRPQPARPSLPARTATPSSPSPLRHRGRTADPATERLSPPRPNHPRGPPPPA